MRGGTYVAEAVTTMVEAVKTPDIVLARLLKNENIFSFSSLNRNFILTLQS